MQVYLVQYFHNIVLYFFKERDLVRLFVYIVILKKI